MEMDSLILGLIIVALTVLVVLWPFFSTPRRREEEAASPHTQWEALVAQREAIYATVRSLDFDYDTGKLDPADYRAQREVWVQRGIAVLKALDALQPAETPVSAPTGGRSNPSVLPDLADFDAQIEAAIASRRQAT